jgi:hypothetical protein
MILFNFQFSPFEDSVLFIGRGFSGKSYALDNLVLKTLEGYRRAPYSNGLPYWLFDARSQHRRPGIFTTKFLSDLKYGQCIFQPDDTSPEMFEAFCKKARQFPNLNIVVEEAHIYVRKFGFNSSSFKEIVFADRNHGRNWIALAQRPQDIHNSLLNNANHIFCFAMEAPNDVKYMRDWLGCKAELFRQPQDRSTQCKKPLKGIPMLPNFWGLHKDVMRGFVEVDKVN